MIRKLEPCDIERVMEIWLDGNIEAHSFVPKEYWETSVPMVREQLLQAEVYVYETDGRVQGFVGMQEEYLAGIFVDKNFRSMNIGKRLLNYIKELYPALSLKVYQKNVRAGEFYRREGFLVVSEGIDEDNGETEFTMLWDQRNDEKS